MASAPSVISRAVSSSGGMPNSGMNAVLASAESIAATVMPPPKTDSQPYTQPTFGLASREPHW